MYIWLYYRKYAIEIINIIIIIIVIIIIINNSQWAPHECIWLAHQPDRKPLRCTPD